MLKCGCVLEMMGNHGVIRRSVRAPRRRANHMVVVFIAGSDVVLSHEILGAFVLVRSAIL
jgi:hypothetical protein